MVTLNMTAFILFAIDYTPLNGKKSTLADTTLMEAWQAFG